MKKTKIFKKLFTEQELKENLQEARSKLQKELENRNFTIAAFYSFDIAYIYEFLGDKKKAEYHYQTTIEYVNRAEFKFLWITQECLLALGKHKQALEITLNDPHHTNLELANLYEKAGEYDLSRQLCAELAMEQSEKASKSTFFKPHFLQNASDLWSKACNVKKTREYNQGALQAWEKMKGSSKSLHPIEKAWLLEEVGYIYEKAGNYETALTDYKKAKSTYEEAYIEDITCTLTHQIDGDWDYYKEDFFRVQFLGLRMFKLRVEHPMKYDYRRIRFRILNLKEQT